MQVKICGISDPITLKFLTEHPHSPKFIGFIVNYPKSRRYVEINKLKDLLKIDKKNSSYVAVLVKPNTKILEEIKIYPLIIIRCTIVIQKKSKISKRYIIKK
jgi:phosphoribosylanthranilate isomerase